MSASDIILRRQNRAIFLGTMLKQQAFNNGLIISTKGSNQPTTSAGLLSAIDGKTEITPNEQGLTLAKGLDLVNQILQFEQLVSNNIPTSILAQQFNQSAFSDPQLTIEQNIGSTANTEIVITVPSAPTGLSGTPSTTSIEVSFTAGSDGNSPIINYKYSLNGGEYVAFDPAQTSSPVTISGLSEETAYQIRLKAVNAIGDSVESDMIEVTTTSGGGGATVPDAPTGVSATAPSSTEIYVNFTLGSDGGSPVTGMKFSLNGGPFFDYPVTESPLIFTDLEPSTTYSFKLKAVNAIGDSAESPEVSVTTPAAQY
jgi:hypothetical protein